MPWRNKIVFFIGLVFFLFVLPLGVLAQEVQLQEGKIVEEFSEEQTSQGWQQTLGVLVEKGEEEGKKVKVTTGQGSLSGRRFAVGDRVVLAASVGPEGGKTYYIADYIRRLPLILLAAVFLILVLVIGGWRGTKGLLGLIISFAVILFLVLPFINQGRNPLLVSVFASVLLIPLLFFSAHGFSRKALAAALGTFLSLLIVIVLAQGFVKLAKISGLSSEEVGFLQANYPGKFDAQGLVLAGIIIGALGVLDDVTVSQASVVQKLRQTGDLSGTKLFLESLSVGRDHIASMVNTLILVYVGASLPLLLLFLDNPQPLSIVLNYEIIAEEIIRTLTGSIGLMTAVPITTFLAVKMIK